GDRKAPGRERSVRTAGQPCRPRQRSAAEPYPVAQPAIDDVPPFFMGIKGIGARYANGTCHGVAQDIAVNVVVSVIRTHRRFACHPTVRGAYPRTEIVRRVVIGRPSLRSSFAAAVELVTVVVLPVACIGVK